MDAFINSFKTQIEYIFNQFKSMAFSDYVDIIIVTVLLYMAYKFIRDRRAGKLALGIMLCLVFFIISDALDMHALKFLLSNIFQVGALAIIIIFQPELRSALEKVGAEPFKSFKNISETKNSQDKTVMIRNLCEAVSDLAKEKTGALIVIERTTKLGDIIKTGSIINANVNPFLLKNIFFNKAPLHDGAVVIVNTRVYSAGCFLPLSTNNDIIKDLGTRHRAAIGMSENSDAIVIVVSEETGTISVAIDGQLKRNYDYGSLKNQLAALLVSNNAPRVKGRVQSKKKN